MEAMNAEHSETALVDDLLQTVATEREELDQLRMEINSNILRLMLCPLETVTASHLIELQEGLTRYAELKRKYATW